MDEPRSFDLLTEPWIVVLDHEGDRAEVSLREIFRRAPTLGQIAGELPTQDFAILRLCVAVLHRALDFTAPEDVDAVPAVLDELVGHWDEVASAVDQYFDDHRDRFDLFHACQPFFQVAGMHTTKGETSGPQGIIADMPPRLPYLTMRSAAAARRIPTPEAARWLVHVQAYDPSGIKTGVVGHPRRKAGKVYPEGVAWTGQLGGLHLLGGTLRDTLLLNLWAVLLPQDDRDRDLPPWEREPYGLGASPDAATRARPAGPVDLYTWQPRRVLLDGDQQGVTGVLITYGDTFAVQDRQQVVRLEPMTLWRYSKPQSQKHKRPIQLPSTHRPAVALWRGLASVVPRYQRQRGEDEAAVSQLVEHAARLSEGRCRLLADGLVTFRAIGVEYGSNNSVISEAIEDSVDLPSAVLDPARIELRYVALGAVSAAKEGVKALAGLARGLARAGGAGTEESAGPGDRAYEAGYATLDEPYRRWLRTTLAGAVEEPLGAEAQWHIEASQLLSGLGEDLVAGVPDKAWVGFGSNGARADVGAVYERFLRDLGRAFPRAKADAERSGAGVTSAAAVPAQVPLAPPLMPTDRKNPEG